MNELLGDTKQVLLWLFGIIGTLLGLVGSLVILFVRTYVKANFVTKEDLQVMRNEISDERERQHQEGLRKLDRIETAVTGTHKRIDDLYRDLMQGNDR